MIRKMRVEVFAGVEAPEPYQLWFWRLRWNNGQIAATSEGYARHGTATVLAGKLARLLNVLVRQV